MVLIGLLLAPVAIAQNKPAGRQLHVSAVKGDDANTGLSADAAFKSIQKACDVVEPGDHVTVHPGVYYENLQLKRSGTADKPITFATDDVARNRVIVTLADRPIREGKVKWELVDADLNMYAIPWTYMPSRILYDSVDLFPYPSLGKLQKFMLGEDNPAPLHGFAFDQATSKLYVRLHAPMTTRHFAPPGVYGQPKHPQEKDAGPYGSMDPNRHQMCVSPAVASGGKGADTNRPDTYNWGVLTEAPAHVVIDGFTFETPGTAGVYVRGSHVTVRNSWFLGCKSGVAGGARDSKDTWKSSDNVIMEFCDYHQFPAYDDVRECISLFNDDPRFTKNRFYWWGRKGNFAGTNTSPKNDYEDGGPTRTPGKDWIVRNNDIHDIFDGVGGEDVPSEGLRVYANRFNRIIDNAIETENYGKNWRIYDNEMIDVFMPISWQPLGGTPWPGPIYVYRNLIYDTPQGAAMWRRAAWPTCWLKVGARPDNWADRLPQMKDVPRDSVTIPGDGFVVFNNTIVLNDGYFLERSNSQDIALKNFKFINNIFVTRPYAGDIAIMPDTGSHFKFSHNLYCPPLPAGVEAGKMVAGDGGIVLDEKARIGFRDPARFQFDLTADSPAIGAGGEDSSIPELSKDMGAIPAGKKWVSPLVGPQPR